MMHVNVLLIPSFPPNPLSSEFNNQTIDQSITSLWSQSETYNSHEAHHGPRESHDFSQLPGGLNASHVVLTHGSI